MPGFVFWSLMMPGLPWCLGVPAPKLLRSRRLHLDYSSTRSDTESPVTHIPVQRTSLQQASVCRVATRLYGKNPARLRSVRAWDTTGMEHAFRAHREPMINRLEPFGDVYRERAVGIAIYVAAVTLGLPRLKAPCETRHRHDEHQVRYPAVWPSALSAHCRPRTHRAIREHRPSRARLVAASSRCHNDEFDRNTTRGHSQRGH
jgi:hypothetical protein